MALASIIHPEHFELGFVRSSDEAANRAKQLVDMNGSYRTRTHDMGGMSSNSKMGDSGLLTMLGNTKVLTLCGEAVSYNDVRSREEQLKIDMVRAFGGEIAQMGEFVAEIMQSLGEGSTLSQDKKDQLFEMVTEIVTLKNLTNVDALPDGQARLETLIAETANKIADILLDGMDNKIVAPAIVEFVHQMLSDTAQNHDIPALDEKITKIEGRMNPEEYLANSVTAMIAELAGILNTQDLSEEAQAEIEALIEKMETALENGEPIPRDVMQALDALPDNYPEIAISQDFSASLDTLKDANIVMKAEVLGITVEQLKAIESDINTLNSELNNADITPEDRAEIENLLEKLEAFSEGKEQLDKGTIDALDKLTDKYSLTPTDSKTFGVLGGLAAIIAGAEPSPRTPSSASKTPPKTDFVAPSYPSTANRWR